MVPPPTTTDRFLQRPWHILSVPCQMTGYQHGPCDMLPHWSLLAISGNIIQSHSYVPPTLQLSSTPRLVLSQELLSSSCPFHRNKLGWCYLSGIEPPSHSHGNSRSLHIHTRDSRLFQRSRRRSSHNRGLHDQCSPFIFVESHTRIRYARATAGSGHGAN